MIILIGILLYLLNAPMWAWVVFCIVVLIRALITLNDK